MKRPYAKRTFRGRKISHRAECLLCGQETAYQHGDACAACRKWLAEYDNGAQYNRDRLLIRQLHALQRRAEQHLPLFEGGKLCV